MEKKLIVEIAEGLGNQLFMHSFAYALSKKFGCKLMIDNKSGYFLKKNHLRIHQKYMLNYFNIKQNIAPKNNQYDTIFKRYRKKIELILDKFAYKKKFIREINTKINDIKVANPLEIPQISQLSDVIYLQGNFENENYFKHLRNDIIKMYQPLTQYINYDNKTINHLKQTNSVSIHIRVNKFTEQPHEINNKINILKSEKFKQDLIKYIYKAVLYFRKKISNPVFFIWSNDIENIKHYFKDSDFIFVSGNDVINDFNLFSYAKHFIVGGSTFHWWGAWLNENPNKICVCSNDINPSNNKNFYPLSWHRI